MSSAAAALVPGNGRARGGRYGVDAESSRDLPGLIGSSPALAATIEAARRAAAHATNVLLVGETGTGKELFARAIHNLSRNAGDPFVAVNCAAIPETMLESELFGHERGAFTDARTSKRGLLEVAGRGTVMLDEVNELPLNLQPKLLRVLEERRVRRLGAVLEYDVGCRIIAATNKDLGALVDAGFFRSDLYYRLNVVRLELPALRDRIGDIELLADHFLRTLCSDHGLAPKRLSAEGLAVLNTHPWLGNVRELKNTLESAIVMCDGDEIRPEHIRLRKRASVPVSGDVILSNPVRDAATEIEPPAGTPAAANIVLHLPPGGVTLETMERLLIEQTMRQSGGNRSLAARMLGVSRPTIARKLAQYALA